MISANRPFRQMFAQSRVVSRFKSSGSPRAAALLILLGLLATTFYSPSSASSVSGSSSFAGVRIGVGGATFRSGFANEFGIPSIGSNAGLGLLALAALQAGPESIVVNAPAIPRPAGCTNPDVFCLGETVTAVVTNAPLREGFRERRILWGAPDGSVPQVVDVTTDPQTDSYLLPTDGIFAQVGTWTVRTINNRGGGVVVATFEVGDPTQPSADLQITMTGPTSVTANTNVSYNVTVFNYGPDPAANVTVVNAVPHNTTFVSAVAPEGWVCTTPATQEPPATTGDIVCTAATSLAVNASAAFTFTFNVNSDVVNGAAVYNIATTETSTNEPNTSNNYADNYSASAPPGGGATCTLDCPDSITAIANTEEGMPSQRGAHVTFAATGTDGDCGAVTTSHVSGSFFAVGTTVVTSTSASNGGSCSFTITVEDQGVNPPTISCPANPPDAVADGNCSAAVTVGTATATGNNVTLYATRSDGRPMYTCDANGNCTRLGSDAPFQAGVTTITWFAYSHNTAGPYGADGDEEGETGEEQHRTGSASCTESVTVNDVTPPVITAQNETLPADANCQVAVPDYTNSVSDNCSCAANDNSEDCIGQHVITLTQSVPAGTLLGPGSYPIHLTANDGSSNNNGAGNTTEKDITLTVSDQTAPVITCPVAITASNDAGQCSATVNPGTATATDNCDTSPTITGTRSDNQALNAPYPKGTTTITWTATDDANNSSSCAQTITVNDTEAPAISCPGNITKNNDPGTCGAVVTYATPVGSDNCPGATTAQTAGLPSGSTFPVGTTTNTFEVTDTSGNKTSCSFTVTVNDVENPTISCPASITLEATCPTGAIATYTAPVGADNCPGATTTRTAGLASGSVFPIGTTTVTYTVNDAHGHSTSCSFTVTVLTPQAVVQNLINSVNASSLTGTQKNGLIAKLNAALDAINDGKKNVACNKLSDFVNSVENLISHGDISAAQGNAWINSANHVGNTIGCTNLPCS